MLEIGYIRLDLLQDLLPLSQLLFQADGWGAVVE
jgi:hypothetical protein